ncbi:MAG: DUF4097 domain-containing protein [Colwellia sp.]|nr:DUF4097 domain-containing protein [Colwellia sp.]
MNIIKKITIVILASITLQAYAGEMVDKSMSAENVNNVSIESLRGDVTIIGWDKKEVSVKGELDDKAERFIFEKHGSTIKIKVVMPHSNNHGWHSGGSTLTIKMPKDSRMNFSGVSTDVILSNLISSSEVHTVSGDIKATDLKKHVELSTVSGSVKSQNLSGKIRLSSVSGDIKDRNSRGRLILRVVSGDIESRSHASEVFVNNVSGGIELALDKIDELEVSTVSGDVDSRLTLNDSGVVKLSSISGDINIRFQSKVQANFRLNASAGGDLENELTNDKAKRAKYGPSSKLYFQTGDGSASFKANTVSGTINLSSK